MRMTNKIMQSNSLYNINQTKILEDKYNNQLTSQSKITRPSDDPVVAIRALRLRSNVSNVNQYYQKNAPDADQWLDVTAQSLNTITDVLTNLYNQVQTGVNKDYTASDMQVLLTQIEAYTNEMYATGNQDYAGRYIFTGYRTDTALTMGDENTAEEINITENIKAAQLDTINYTDYSCFDTTDSAKDADETKITNAIINRLRVSYNDLRDDTFSIKFYDADGNILKDASGNDEKLEKSDFSTGSGKYQIFSSAEDAYKAMTSMEAAGGAGEPQVAFVPSTGEILYSSTFTVGDPASNPTDLMENGGSISINYTKDKWATDDLNPKHYFHCTAKGIEYNRDGNVDTEITYDVGYNQVIQVNTNASEVFDPAISRDYDDLKTLISQFSEIESIRAKYKETLEGLEASKESNPTEYATAKKQYDAADKAYTYIRDAVSVRFGDQITRYQNYLDATNVAITKNGTRSTRLELISSRLSTQASTFRELQEENEGIDMTEVAVLLTSAETTYDAALAATGKIMKNSLINYI